MVRMLRRSTRGRKPSVKLLQFETEATTTKTTKPAPKAEHPTPPLKSTVKAKPKGSQDGKIASVFPRPSKGYVPSIICEDDPETVSNNWDKPEDLDEVLRKLHIGLRPTENNITQPNLAAPVQSEVSPGFGYLPDPSMILRGPNKTKHLDIVDFVNLAAPYQETPTSHDALDVIESIVKAKTGPVRPRLEDVTIAEWNLANVRIMDELFQPSQAGVRNYWACTARVNSMFRDKDLCFVIRIVSKCSSLTVLIVSNRPSMGAIGALRWLGLWMST